MTWFPLILSRGMPSKKKKTTRCLLSPPQKSPESPRCGVSPGPSVCKTDALSRSYRGAVGCPNPGAADGPACGTTQGGRLAQKRRGQEDSGLEKKAAAGKNPELGTSGCQERSHCAQTAQRGVCAAGSLQLGAGGACPATGGSKPPLGTEPRTFSLQD